MKFEPSKNINQRQVRKKLELQDIKVNDDRMAYAHDTLYSPDHLSPVENEQ